MIHPRQAFDRLRSAALGIAAAASTAPLSVGAAFGQSNQTTQSSDSAQFDIPAQALEGALVEYGRVANVQVLYDAQLMSGQRSAAIRGRYLRRQALQLLLRGTGLRTREAGGGAVTLLPIDKAANEVLALGVMRAEASPLGDSRRFLVFAQAVQAAIIEALRSDPRTDHGRFEVTLHVWLAPDGAVTKATLGTGSGDAEQDATILERARSVRISRPLPAGLPQPIAFRFRAMAPS